MRLLALGVLLVTATAEAQSLGISVMDAPGVSDASVKKLHKTAVEQLRALSALPVSDAYDWKGPKRACPDSDAACQLAKVKATGASGAVALWLTSSRATAVFWLDGEKASASRDIDLSADLPEATFKTLLDGVLPGWLKKGMGGVRLSEDLAPGSVLKVDGRVQPVRKGVIAVSAGAHQLDVVYPDGRAVLQGVDVTEGARTRVDVAPAAGVSTSGGGASAFSALRVASYAAWMVGTATLLSAFIVAFVGRQTGAGQQPCRVDSRTCVTLEEATEKQRQAAGYASTANVLLGTGLALSLAGAGLFTFDVLR